MTISDKKLQNKPKFTQNHVGESNTTYVSLLKTREKNVWLAINTIGYKLLILCFVCVFSRTDSFVFSGSQTLCQVEM